MPQARDKNGRFAGGGGGGGRAKAAAAIGRVGRRLVNNAKGSGINKSYANNADAFGVNRKAKAKGYRQGSKPNNTIANPRKVKPSLRKRTYY